MFATAISNNTTAAAAATTTVYNKQKIINKRNDNDNNNAYETNTQAINAEFQPVLRGVLRAADITGCCVMIRKQHNDYMIESDEHNLMHSYTDTISRYSICGSDKLQTTLKHCCDSTEVKAPPLCVSMSKTANTTAATDDASLFKQHNMPIGKSEFVQYIVSDIQVSLEMLPRVIELSNTIYDHLINTTKFFNAKRCKSKLLDHVKTTIHKLLLDDLANTIVKQQFKTPKYIKNVILSKSIRKSYLPLLAYLASSSSASSPITAKQQKKKEEKTVVATNLLLILLILYR